MRATKTIITWENRDMDYRLTFCARGKKCGVFIHTLEGLTLRALLDLKGDLEEVIATMGRGD